MPRKYEKYRLIKADTPEYAKELLRDRDALLAEAQRRRCSAELLEDAMRAKVQTKA